VLRCAKRCVAHKAEGWHPSSNISYFFCKGDKSLNKIRNLTSLPNLPNDFFLFRFGSYCQLIFINCSTLTPCIWTAPNCSLVLTVVQYDPCSNSYFGWTTLPLCSSKPALAKKEIDKYSFLCPYPDSNYGATKLQVSTLPTWPDFLL
jgi:hypothetical protein